MNEWRDFKGEKWKKSLNVEDFIINNYKECVEGIDFLADSSKKTERVWSRCEKLLDKEFITGVLDVDVSAVAGIDNYEAGYIDKKNEVIFGLQTDELLKRIVNPFGGIEAANKVIGSYGYQLDKEIRDGFSAYRKTYDKGINDSYTEDIIRLRDAKVLLGLPEEFGRGMILGDYRRLALYGADYLIKRKERDLNKLIGNINFAMIRIREEISEQIRALKEIKLMAYRYGIDISRPADNAKEAVQWLYFAFLATVKQSNGLVNAFGRNSTFLDIYIERDIEAGVLTEAQAQELIDQLFIKLRVVRHLRNVDYKETITGESNWITETVGGMLNDNQSLVTKTTYRFLHTLKNLNTATEPIFVVLWSDKLPLHFKEYVSELALKTNVIQFINDDKLRPVYGTDYAIIGGTSAVKLGKQMMYYGASLNLVKALLYAVNGGKDEITKKVVIEGLEILPGPKLDYQSVVRNFVKVMNKFIGIYIDALSVIHYMHDKYSYESSSMAFLDTITVRHMSINIAGLSTVADSLSAMCYAGMQITRDENDIINDFQSGKDFPRYGNDDERADKIATDIVRLFSKELKKQNLYRNSECKLSIQSISDNICHGAMTGDTPDGREYGNAFSQGANPSSGYDDKGVKSSMNSVAKIPYNDVCEGGFSNTMFIEPDIIDPSKYIELLNYYFKKGGQHININAMFKDDLLEAQRNPEKGKNLFVGLSGCSVKFNNLTRAQQEELIGRTFHEDL